jgi:hypothetical protein
MMSKKNNLVYQFKITLWEIEPDIWRRIQVPENYTFWDLHVAINDAMGWFDSHLHEFQIKIGNRKEVKIGIYPDEFGEETILMGWDVPITDFLTQIGQDATYWYDFGDSWYHQILFEGILFKVKKTKYPLCLAGERACPPEDCGGVNGYYRLLEILKNPKHEEYESYVEWLSSHYTNYHPYNPDAFDFKKVRFDDSKKRLKQMLNNS